jgi:CheY-like chemotaxis protein
MGRRVLVIDDEEAILQMVREVLTRRGYEVDIARDGETGLERLDKAAYDVMLCDWKMPGINGQEVYERLQTRHSELADRVIFITGDVVNEHAQEFLTRHNKLCLAKPFSLADFREAIGKVLPKAA